MLYTAFQRSIYGLIVNTYVEFIKTNQKGGMLVLKLVEVRFFSDTDKDVYCITSSTIFGASIWYRYL